MKSPVTIIHKDQFGYHTDTFKYACYLEGRRVSYIGFDREKEKRDIAGVEIVYVKWTDSKLTNAVNFLKAIYNHLKKQERGDVFVVDFGICFLIPFFNRKLNYILDIRTLSVSGWALKRWFKNILTKFNTFFYDTVSVISEGIGEELNLRKYMVLPLGADTISDCDKDFRVPNLVYIGTFNNREIYKAIAGYCRFIKDCPEFREVSRFHIIGDGKADEVERVQKAVEQYDTYTNVLLHGYLPHEQAKKVFDKCNIGISFVPIENYYRHQPATKTFEYLRSGLICIATNNLQHRESIDVSTGILCKDNTEGVCQALHTFVERKDRYSSEVPRQESQRHAWRNIVRSKLEPLLITGN